MKSHLPKDLLGSLTVLGVVGALALSLALSGCGGGSSSDQSAAEVKVTASTGKAKRDVDNLTWGLPEGEPSTIDPTLAGFYNSALVAANLCEPFERLRPDTSTAPNLGSLDRVSPTEYVFNLKKGIDFWDGHEATGEDLLFSFEWAARPESFAALAYENVATMKQTGPYQVTVTLKSPDALYEKELGTNLATALIEKEFTEKAGEKFGTPEGGVMCTGPFELAKWESGQQMILTRNESYWNPAGKAKAKTVDVKFLNDSTALTQALASGEVDGAYGLPAAVVPKLSKTPGGTVYYGPSQEYLTLTVTTPTSELNEPKLFKALSLSIDRPAVAQAIFYGGAQPNYTFVGKNSWPPEAEAPWKAAYPKYEKELQYDPTAAKKMVEESGYEGKPLVLTLPAGDETLSQTAQLLQQEASKAGIKLKLDPLPPAQFQTAQYTAADRKGTDLEIFKSFTILKDPIETLPNYLTPGEIYNYDNYDNPKVTKLLAQARETLDPLKRSEMLVEVQELYEPEASRMTILTPYGISFLNNKLTGATTSGNWIWTPSLAGIGGK